MEGLCSLQQESAITANMKYISLKQITFLTWVRPRSMFLWMGLTVCPDSGVGDGFFVQLWLTRMMMKIQEGINPLSVEQGIFNWTEPVTCSAKLFCSLVVESVLFAVEQRHLLAINYNTTLEIHTRSHLPHQGHMRRTFASNNVP